MKSKCPEKFAWECDDGMWVMGPIGDMLLKKVRGDVQDGSNSLGIGCRADGICLVGLKHELVQYPLSTILAPILAY